GKTHLAVGLGLKAIECGYRVLFTTAANMIGTLTKALAEGRLEEKLKLYTVPRLLIIDEIGYLPIDQSGANLFFQLISRRYERGPLVLTSNQAFGSWGRRVRRSRHRRRDPRPRAAPRHHRQHPRQQLSVEGQAQGWTRPGGRRGRQLITGVGSFRC